MCEFQLRTIRTPTWSVAIPQTFHGPSTAFLEMGTRRLESPFKLDTPFNELGIFPGGQQLWPLTLEGHRKLGILTTTEITQRVNRGELIREPRRKKNSSLDVEVDSYDLAAGTAIWKQPTEGGNQGEVKTLKFTPKNRGEDQPTLTVQPGQMIFVVTLENVVMPQDLCGTVYSRNSLALKGILALNAGHVDPGYEGPIAIRLINLRAMPWTLTLGEPIFTITFQTLESDIGVKLARPRLITQEAMIRRVRETADAALSNALYDLYALNVDERLKKFLDSAREEIRDERDKYWVRRDKIWSVLLSSIWSKSIAVIAFLALVTGAIFMGMEVFDYKPWK